MNTQTATKKRGRKTARPDGEQLVSVRLPVEIYRVLRAIVGLRKDRSINDIANKLFAEWVSSEQKNDPIIATITEALKKELAQEKDAKRAAVEKQQAKKRRLNKPVGKGKNTQENSAETNQ